MKVLFDGENPAGGRGHITRDSSNGGRPIVTFSARWTGANSTGLGFFGGFLVPDVDEVVFLFLEFSGLLFHEGLGLLR